uniref:Gp 88 n=1 Tax=Murid herpesvirus 1 TaxID=10366 RepID=Q83183_MUHV1|nr:gp 88 [Murid betaherpesvirus 1]prf//2023328A Fc receptor [Murid betaherpesvirus 1]
MAPSTLIALCLLAAVTAHQLPACQWRLPTETSVPFNISCDLVNGSTVKVWRDLCGEGNATEGWIGMARRGDKLHFSARWNYSTADIGVYYVNVTERNLTTPLTQLITPPMTIWGMRQGGRSRDFVLCTVTGIFSKGEFTLEANGATVLSVNFTKPGRYAVKKARVSLDLSHRNGTMRFLVSIRGGPMTHVKYQCIMTPLSCVPFAVSKPLMLEYRQTMPSGVKRYTKDSTGTEVANRVCCKLDDYHNWDFAKRVTVTRTTVQCAEPQFLFAFDIPPYMFYIAAVEKPLESVLMLYDVDTWNYAFTSSGVCIQTSKKTGVGLPPGEYQCIFERESGSLYGRPLMVHGSITIEAKTTHDFVSRVEIQITCTFDAVSDGAFTLERVEDGQPVYQSRVGTNESFVSDDSISINGSRLSEGKISVSVYLREDDGVIGRFRCRVRSGCLNLVSRAITVTKPTRMEYALVTEEPVTSPQTTTTTTTTTTTPSPPSPAKKLEEIRIKVDGTDDDDFLLETQEPLKSYPYYPLFARVSAEGRLAAVACFFLAAILVLVHISFWISSPPCNLPGCVRHT